MKLFGKKKKADEGSDYERLCAEHSEYRASCKELEKLFEAWEKVRGAVLASPKGQGRGFFSFLSDPAAPARAAQGRREDMRSVGEDGPDGRTGQRAECRQAQCAGRQAAGGCGGGSGECAC